MLKIFLVIFSILTAACANQHDVGTVADFQKTGTPGFSHLVRDPWQTISNLWDTAHLLSEDTDDVKCENEASCIDEIHSGCFKYDDKPRYKKQ